MSDILGMKPNYGYGMGGGIRSLLSPLTNMITQQLAKQSQESFNDKIDPYIDQVETLTTETFPELNMSSTGGGIGNFPSPSINAPVFQPRLFDKVFGVPSIGTMGGGNFPSDLPTKTVLGGGSYTDQFQQALKNDTHFQNKDKFNIIY